MAQGLRYEGDGEGVSDAVTRAAQRIAGLLRIQGKTIGNDSMEGPDGGDYAKLMSSPVKLPPDVVSLQLQGGYFQPEAERA